MKLKAVKFRGYFLFFVLILFFTVSVAGCSKLPVEHEVVTPSDGKIVLPLEKVGDGKVHFFTYKKSGKRINFFVRTDGEGDLSAYFDACYTCYKFKKGYRTEGTDLICNECNLKFGISEKIWENKDCSPIMFKSHIENRNLIIEASTLEKGARLF
ncbi:MAG: DUF2318 domain-containing protein [Nitrospirota bacterium]|nr:DUF2318 domain-containing protein [Nitrospirota bacterium]